MDTTSHICMGAAVGLGAATILHNHDVNIATTTIVGLSIIANVFPDIDVIFKLKNNYTYINFHRGFSHSIVFALLWIILLSTTAYLLNNQQHFWIFALISTLGIGLHIFTDLLNGYGVQFMWPFKKQWIAFGLTYTFDALLFIVHIIAFILILGFHFPVLITLGVTYAILITYIIISYFYHYYLKQQLIKKYGNFKRLILQARSHPYKWKYVYETNDKNFYIGLINKKKIIQLRHEERQEILAPELEAKLREDKNVKAFIDFTPIFNYSVIQNKDGSLIIKFYDLRYLMVKKDNQYYIFNCIVKVINNRITKSYMGFVVSQGSEDKHFEKVKEITI